MIPKYLSETFTSYAAVLGDHLWQSTLFAFASGALTVFLRNNHARARYWLWLAASLKFLVPFSVLVGIGSHFAWTRSSVAGMRTGLYFAVEEVSQPFTQAVAATPVISRGGTLAGLPGLIHWLPFLLAAVWLCGFVAVLAVWGVRWRKISASIRGAVLLSEGREVELLRRIERISGMQQPIKMLLSSSLEPGIFGIAHPTLLWPHGISEHLEDAHLEAILAHEVWHARRRDNLTAAIHMLVEGLFWFHPLVWWLGARLVDERERACDEGVLELGSECQAYAESILKTCEFCVGSALSCVSGVTGADLKKRIVHIMTRPVVHKLSLRKQALLGVAGIVAIAAPIVFGLVSTTPQSASPKAEDAAGKAFTYEVASIKPEKSGGMGFRVMNTPDGFTADTTVQMLIRIAYGIEDNQISGAPGWVNSDKYDVEAKMDQATANEVRKLSEDNQQEPARQRMLQALLADRFKLTTHRETKELPIYSLAVAKGGPKLHEAKPGDTYPNGIKGPNGRPGGHLMRMGRGELTAQSIELAQLGHLLSEQMGRTVIDNTGLKGHYDFTLKWTPDRSTPMLSGATGSDSAPLPDSGPSIFTAIQEQLGLKLESQKGPVELLVIDHVEKPSEN